MSALVLAGGGANGAFQAGVLRELGGGWDAVYGVSAGALNAILAGQGRLADLEALWLHEAPSMVRRRSIWRAAWGILGGDGGLYDVSRLVRAVEREAAGRYLIPTHVGYVDMAAGEYRTARHTDARWAEKAVASAAIPIAFPQLRIRGVPVADGGVRNVTPLNDAIRDGHDRITVILCSTGVLAPVADVSGLVERVSRTLEIMMHEIAINDLARTRQINELIEAGRAEPHHRRIEITEIRPSRGLGGALDFSRAHIEAALEQGRRDARDHLRRRAA